MMLVPRPVCLLAAVLVAVFVDTTQALEVVIIPHETTTTTTTKPPLSIDVFSKFDEEKIRREYVGQKPYLLRGIGNQWPAMNWDMDYVSQTFGDTTVWAYQYDRTSTKKSYLAHALLHRKRMTINNFLANYFQTHSKEEDSSWSLKECGEVFEEHPHLIEQVHFDQVYAGPLEESVPRQAYFWIGNANSSIGLHADIADFSNLYQIQGRKKWIFFAPNDQDNLYMETKSAVDGGLYSPLNVFDPIDLQKYPKFALAQPYEIIMEPGDILYVPSGWWHAVHSMTATMSVNYIASHDLLEGSSNYSVGSALEALRFLLALYLLDGSWSANFSLVGLALLVIWGCILAMARRRTSKKGRGATWIAVVDSGCKML